MNMLSVYEKILNTCGYTVTEDGAVKKEINGKSLPVLIRLNDEERYMKLPTYDNLRSADVTNTIFFHPFQENIVRGESKVLSVIRKELNHHYGACLSALMLDIVKIAAGSVAHSDLTAKQKKIIASIGNVDNKFSDTFESIIKALLKRETNNTPAVLSMRKGHKWGGTLYSRVAFWTSPLYEEVSKMAEESKTNKDYQPKLFGVSIRKGDIQSYVNLCQLFFPHMNEVGHDFYGSSNGKSAPYCEAFIRSLVTLPLHTNSIAETFYKGKYTPVSKAVAEDNLNYMTLDVQWILELADKDGEFNVVNWKKEYQLIPLQEGNEGQVSVNEGAPIQETPNLNKGKQWDTITQEAAGNAVTTPAPVAPAQPAQPAQVQPVQQQYAQPVAQPQPAKTSHGNIYLDQMQPIVQPQPVYPYPQPVAQGYPYPPAYPAYPVAQQPAVNTHPAVAHHYHAVQQQSMVPMGSYNGYRPGFSRDIPGTGQTMGRGYPTMGLGQNHSRGFFNNGFQSTASSLLSMK